MVKITYKSSEEVSEEERKKEKSRLVAELAENFFLKSLHTELRFGTGTSWISLRRKKGFFSVDEVGVIWPARDELELNSPDYEPQARAFGEAYEKRFGSEFKIKASYPRPN